MALGASPERILHQVVGADMTLSMIGVGLGRAGALALTRPLASLLFGVTAADPRTYMAVAGFLGVVALAAGCLPARRATRVDPAVAIRAE